MSKKKSMTHSAARRIQSAVDSGRAKKADSGFKARAQRAASKHSRKKP